jgi:hypothetical protein
MASWTYTDRRTGTQHTLTDITVHKDPRVYPAGIERQNKKLYFTDKDGNERAWLKSYGTLR